MDDLYQYLISGAPNQAQLPAIVEQLRNRRSLGELGQLTGDRVLSPFGQGLTKQTDKYAEDLQGIRQSDIDDKRQQGLADQQGRYQNEILRLTGERDKERAAYNKKMADAAAVRARAAMLKAGRTGAVPKPMSMTAIKELSGKKLERDKIVNLKDGFKDEYARKAIPGGRTAANFLVRTLPMLASKEDKAAAEWWREFQMDFNILARNQMFGATLSANEKLAWDKATAGEEMEASQITTILASMERWKNQELGQLADTMAGTFDPAQVAGAAGREYTPPVEEAPPPEALAELQAAVEAGDLDALNEFAEAYGAQFIPEEISHGPVAQ